MTFRWIFLFEATSGLVAACKTFATLRSRRTSNTPRLIWLYTDENFVTPIFA
jgi:hypothetical protein